MSKSAVTRRQAVAGAGAGGIALLLGGVRLGTSGRAPLEQGVDEALAATCTMTPAKTVGPYFVDEKLNRSDVRESQAGIPLSLTLYVFDADNDCKPVSGAQVDIWHCNAGGIYSDESANNTAGQTWLRGYQVTDANGKVNFTTIYPGWYSGRAIHIHYKVRVYDGTTETLEFTSQLFFTDAQNSQVLADSRYSAHGTKPDTTDATDNIYANDTSLLLQPTGSNAAGYAAEFSVGVSQKTSQLNNTSEGGGAPGGGMGGGPGGMGAPPNGTAPTTTADTSVAAQLASITSLKAGRHRQLKIALTTTEAVTVAAKLTRGGRTLAADDADLAVGTHSFRVTIPAAVSAGGAQLTLTVTDAAGNKKTIRKAIHVRKRP
jgi:protocatechuate 3,4-dioxygenase beta subunit